jgi:heme exporter protein C
LRGSVDDEQKRARFSAVYNVFAYVMMNVFILIMPRLTASLHPGNGGNPAFKSYDLDNQMRMVFYPATIGWIIIGVWILTLQIRKRTIETKLENIAE